MKIRAWDAQGALSEDGAGTNNAFASSPDINATATLTIAPPVGYQHANFTLIARSDEHRDGEPAVGLSLDGETFTPGALAIGSFTGPVEITAKALGACTHPGLRNDYAGFTVLPVVEGAAGSDSAASGAAVEVEPVSGTAGSTSGAAGDAVAAGVDIETVEGVAGSTSEASGAVASVEPVDGGAGSDSGVTGAAVDVEVAAGTAGSTSGATGAATVQVTVTLTSLGGDGAVANSSLTSWAACAKRSGAGISNTGTSAQDYCAYSSKEAGTWYNYRGFFPFSNAAKAGVAPVDAKFTFTPYGAAPRTVSLVLVGSRQANTALLANSDYDKIGDSSGNLTELAPRVTVSGGSSAPVTFTLNAAGLAYVQAAAAGVVKLAVMTSQDYDLSDPGNETVYYAKTNFAENGTGKPTLVLTY